MRAGAVTARKDVSVRTRGTQHPLPGPIRPPWLHCGHTHSTILHGPLPITPLPHLAWRPPLPNGVETAAVCTTWSLGGWIRHRYHFPLMPLRHLHCMKKRCH
jgi:hypothetical protein